MTAAVRAFVPILRRLRSVDWDRVRCGDEYQWRRGGTANLQQITVNASGWSVQIDGRHYSSTAVEFGEAWSALAFVGAFDPAPERVNYRNVKAVA